MESKKVEVGTRKIKATWTREMAKDLSSFHGIDEIQDLEDKLVDQFRKELDPGYRAEQKRKEREKKLKRIYGEKDN